MTTMAAQRLYSGIQPTGDLHIGNYFGAVSNWAKLQEKYDAVYGIVDYHAMTIDYDASTMKKRVHDVARSLLSCGLDPEKCTLYVQSHVPAHTELMWILATVTNMGRLTNMTAFKEKSAQHEENINLGLLAYPVLQAADILLYKGEVVPVGEDQLQHLELSRELARRFNFRFEVEVFPEPKPLLSSAPRILGLDGQSKMSKSLGNYIAITETEEDLWTKLAPAFTDPARLRRKDPGNPDICNIFSLHKIVSLAETVEEINTECRAAGIGCVDCKKRLAANLNAVLEPIRQRDAELRANPDEVDAVLAKGGQRCREIAAQTVSEARKAAGLD